MADRASLRKHFLDQQNQATQKAEQAKQLGQQVAALRELEKTILGAFQHLVLYLDGKTTKTEITNHLKQIGTPDVAKVVTSIEKLDKTTLANKVDLKPLEVILSAIQTELEKVPKELPEVPDPVEAVVVTNLDEIKLDITDLEKAIKGLKLTAAAPIINTEKTDLSPLQNVMLDLLKAFNKLKLEVPAKIEIGNLKDVPLADLSEVEKKLDESNKQLKEIAGKKFGGGGGGGESTLPFPLYADKTTTVVRVGVIDTITETDGQRTLVTTVDETDPNNLSISENWV